MSLLTVAVPPDVCALVARVRLGGGRPPWGGPESQEQLSGGHSYIRAPAPATSELHVNRSELADAMEHPRFPPLR